MSDQEQDIILERLKSGDKEAFRLFYEKHRRYLMVMATSILKDEMEAQDLVQDFFTDFWQKQLYNRIKLDVPGTSINGYVNRAVYNRCLDRLKQKNSEQKRINTMGVCTETGSHEDCIQRREWQSELSEALQRAIGEVPPQSVKVFEMAFVQHKSRQEIATELSISPHTVKNQLQRAIKILRAKLKKVSF
jgi:RNA polymerase sigma-70 factor (family 1)